MDYIVKGNFSASLCRNFSESLNDVELKVYRLDRGEGEEKVRLDIAPYLEPLSDRAIARKETFLVGKGTLDTQGNYKIVLDAAYQGGPLVMDMIVDRVPGQIATIGKTVQFVVQKIQPIWRERDGNCYYSYNHRLPFEFWSQIRMLFDAWLICGYLKSGADRRLPLKNVKIMAFDADWVKDDFLGETLTDESGAFRIDYSGKDFKKTFLSPFINVETPFRVLPGPGVYFKAMNCKGDYLLEESRSLGKQEGRKNIPNCFYVDLYTDFEKGISLEGKKSIGEK